MDCAPELIGLDWGTSAVRAYLLGARGTVLARRAEPWGIMTAPGRDFAAVFATLTADWRRDYPDVPALACGMVGSTEGWVRAAYCACPVGIDELAAALVTVPRDRAAPLRVVPGVELRGPAPNVMRGEETQIAGALERLPAFAADATLVLPGTHAKWAQVRAGRIVDFQTYLTGELYALLATQSILGRPAQQAGADAADDVSAADAAFDRAVRTVRANGARGGAALLFLTRSLVLSGELTPRASLAYLSGLLIGEELRAALLTPQARIALIGDPALCARYRRALAGFDVDVERVPIVDDSAPAGLWCIARRALD